jgi:hypothetical protein
MVQVIDMENQFLLGWHSFVTKLDQKLLEMYRVVLFVL